MIQVRVPLRRDRRGGARARRRRSVLVSVACLSLSICAQGARAQETAPAASGFTDTALLDRIRLLEDRLAKVEAALRAANAPCPVAAAPAAAEESARDIGDPPPPPTQRDAPAPPARGLSGFFGQIEVSGLIDAYYAYNFNRPASRRNALRSFDTRHNQFGLPLVELVLEKRPADNSRLGFRLDLGFGPAVDFLSSAEPGGVEVYKHIHQAYGSYLAPVGTGLQIDAGKFVSWTGAEWDESKDNWNYSRGLLYTFAQPGYHTGGRANYDFNSKVGLFGAVVNGWDNVEDNNGGKSYALGLNLTPTKRLSLSPSYLIGPEQPDDRRSTRQLFDLILNYDLSERVSLMGNYDYATEKLPDGSRVRWQGLAAYLRYAPTERLAFSPRFEWYSDRDGYTTGAAQTLKEFTLTGEYKLQENLLARLEYRRDWSDMPIFERAGTGLLSRHQATVQAGFVWSFRAKAAADSDAQSGGTAVRTSTPKRREFLAADGAQAPNPILSAPFFVRQQYLDLLGREPDDSGFSAWLYLLGNCPDENDAPGCDRATVSAAFLNSTEFQEKGYFIFKFHKVAFGQLPEYATVAQDMNRLTGTTSTELSRSKAAFARDFTERKMFRASYTALSNADFVEALLRPYGLTSIVAPDPAKPDGLAKVALTDADLSEHLDAGTLSRAQVLRAIVDSEEVGRAELNTAFVAMQYYCYLRRTPDPDGFGGWLRYIDGNPTDYRTIVNGFLRSQEYRLRFGQP